MGYYIQTSGHHNKAEEICKEHDAIIIPEPKSFSEVPPDHALICVVNNGPFEAAAYCYSEKEFLEFAKPDGRSRKWVLMDKAEAERLSGYK